MSRLRAEYHGIPFDSITELVFALQKEEPMPRQIGHRGTIVGFTGLYDPDDGRTIGEVTIRLDRPEDTEWDLRGIVTVAQERGPVPEAGPSPAEKAVIAAAEEWYDRMVSMYGEGYVLGGGSWVTPIALAVRAYREGK